MPILVKIVPYVLCLVHLLVCFWYYKRQASGMRIGGPISLPKITWLFLTTFHYFLLAPYLLFSVNSNEPMNTALLAFCLLIVFRMLLQLVLMFWLKKWTPVWGISFNFLFVSIIGLILSQGSEIDYGPVSNKLILLHLITLSLMMLVDSYYAWTFKSLVGQQTKGEQAIWYASEQDPKFASINRQTKVLNMFFVFLGLIEFSLLVQL